MKTKKIPGSPLGMGKHKKNLGANAHSPTPKNLHQYTLTLIDSHALNTANAVKREREKLSVHACVRVGVREIEEAC